MSVGMYVNTDDDKACSSHTFGNATIDWTHDSHLQGGTTTLYLASACIANQVDLDAVLMTL
jgi:hypothetical protein